MQEGRKGERRKQQVKSVTLSSKKGEDCSLQVKNMKLQAFPSQFQRMGDLILALKDN